MTDDDNIDKDYRAYVANMSFQLEIIVCFWRFFMNEVLQSAQFRQTEILTTHVYTQVVFASFWSNAALSQNFVDKCHFWTVDLTIRAGWV